MKWLFILLLLSNVFYLGWEIQRDTRLHVRSAAAHGSVPDDVQQLTLLAELPQKPPLRDNPVAADPGGAAQPSPTGDDNIAATAGSGDAPVGDIYTAMPDPVNIENDSLLLDMVRERAAEREALPDSAACFSFGPFGRKSEFVSLQDWFDQRRQQTNERVEYEQDRELFWVYLAPMTDQQAAVATLSELKSQGIKDYRLIRKGSFKNAISLGLFSSQASVNRRLSELNAKGYQPVVVPYHDSEATRIYWLDVALADNPALTREIFNGFPARFNSVPKDCDEIAMIGNNP